MTYPIDVTLVHMPEQNTEWVDACIASLEHQPVNLHHVKGVRGDCRQSRWDGLQLGSAPYVSYVDLDDIVLDGAFARLLMELDAHPSAVGAYSLSDTMDDAGVSRGLLHPFRPWCTSNLLKGSTEVHQLVVTERQATEAVFQQHWNNIPPMVYNDMYVYAMMGAVRPFIAVDVVGYRWRLHDNNMHHTYEISSFDRMLIFKQLKSAWYQADSVCDRFGFDHPPGITLVN